MEVVRLSFRGHTSFDMPKLTLPSTSRLGRAQCPRALRRAASDDGSDVLLWKPSLIYNIQFYIMTEEGISNADNGQGVLAFQNFQITNIPNVVRSLLCQGVACGSTVQGMVAYLTQHHPHAYAP